MSGGGCIDSTYADVLLTRRKISTAYCINIHSVQLTDC